MVVKFIFQDNLSICNFKHFQDLFGFVHFYFMQLQIVSINLLSQVFYSVHTDLHLHLHCQKNLTQCPPLVLHKSLYSKNKTLGLFLTQKQCSSGIKKTGLKFYFCYFFIKIRILKSLKYKQISSFQALFCFQFYWKIINWFGNRIKIKNQF